MKRKNILFALLFLGGSLACCGQNAPPSLNAYFASVRTGIHPLPPSSIRMALSLSSYLDSVHAFLQDTVAVVRAAAYDLTAMVSLGSRDPAIRRKGAEMLVEGCKDPQPENTVRALELLTQFKRTDFSPVALDAFRTRVRAGCAAMDRALKIAGFLGLADLAADIRVWSQPGNAVPVRWAALLALARLGDASAIANIARRVKKFPVNDNLVYEIFPDLIYTRRRDLVAIAIEVLSQDEKSCLSSNPEREEPIPCGYRIMEMLAPVIEGYPLRLDESGDVATDDYPAALRRVRAFFSAEKEYTILTDQY